MEPGATGVAVTPRSKPTSKKTPMCTLFLYQLGDQRSRHRNALARHLSRLPGIRLQSCTWLLQMKPDDVRLERAVQLVARSGGTTFSFRIAPNDVSSELWESLTMATAC